MIPDLKAAHDRLAGILGSTAEPLDVLERVEEHRQYWRPDKMRAFCFWQNRMFILRRGSWSDRCGRSLPCLRDCPRAM
jgi:hypothetical protein